MATLYEISLEFQRLYDLADEMDLTREELADTLEGLDWEFEDKADSYAVVIRSLEGDIASLKSEIERLSNRKRTIKNNISRMKEALEMAMRTSNKTKFKTKLFSFGIQKNPPSLKIDQPDMVPEEYLIPQAPKVDNTAIKRFLKALDEDDHCSWAHLEQSESLQIR